MEHVSNAERYIKKYLKGDYMGINDLDNLKQFAYKLSKMRRLS